MATAKIVAMWGQSNCEGAARLASIQPELSGVIDRAWIYSGISGTFIPMEAGKTLSTHGLDLDPTNGVSAEQGDCYGVEIRLAQRLTALYPNEDIFFVKLGLGSTIIDVLPTAPDWHPTSGEYYSDFVAKIQAAQTQLVSQFAAYDATDIIKVICQHGESDGVLSTTANLYQTNQNAFITQLRTDFGSNPTTPIPYILVKPSTDLVNALPINITNVATIRTAMDNLAGALSAVHVFDADGAQLYTTAPSAHTSANNYEAYPYEAPDIDPWNNWYSSWDGTTVPNYPQDWTVGFSRLHYDAVGVDRIARGIYQVYVDNYFTPSTVGPLGYSSLKEGPLHWINQVNGFFDHLNSGSFIGIVEPQITGTGTPQPFSTGPYTAAARQVTVTFPDQGAQGDSIPETTIIQAGTQVHMGFVIDNGRNAVGDSTKGDESLVARSRCQFGGFVHYPHTFDPGEVAYSDNSVAGAGTYSTDSDSGNNEFVGFFLPNDLIFLFPPRD